MTKEEFEVKLEQAIANGEMTSEEAEMEWQDFTHEGEDVYSLVYGW